MNYRRQIDVCGMSERLALVRPHMEYWQALISEVVPFLSPMDIQIMDTGSACTCRDPHMPTTVSLLYVEALAVQVFLA